MDEWLEEDEPAIVHARDPYHRVDMLAPRATCGCRVNGEVVAESRRPLALFETGLPTRWYFPREDVRLDLLTPSDTHDRVRLQGLRLLLVGRRRARTSCGRIPSPRREVERIRDYLAFFNERVDIEVDGEPQERPVTQWSPRGRS